MADNPNTTAVATPPLNELVVKWRNKYPGAYDKIDDATLTKKILAKYPVYSPLAAPKSHPPSLPKELEPYTFSERIGRRIEQNINTIPNALQMLLDSGNPKSYEHGTADYDQGLVTAKGKAAAKRDLDEEAAASRQLVTGGAKTQVGKDLAAVTIAPRMAYGQIKQYFHDPATFFGDLVTFLPALTEINLRPATNKVWTPTDNAPRPTLLDPEAQAKYTAALDKANESFKADAGNYHEKITKAFDEAKEEHTKAVAKYDDAAAEAAAKADKARADWIEKSRAYEKARIESEAQAQKARTLTQGVKDTVQATFDNLKQTYKTGRAALDSRWNAWNKNVAGVTRDPKGVYDAIEEAKAKRLRGSPGSLKEFNDLLGELGVQEFEDTPEGRKAITSSGPIPIETLRTHYSAIVRRIMQGKLPGNIYHALQDVRAVINEQIIEGAKSRMGESHPLYEASGGKPLGDLVADYEKLKADEHQFMSDWDDHKSPLRNALIQLDANFLRSKILGVGNEYIARQLGRYTQYGADPALPAKAVRMFNEARETVKPANRIKVPKEPGPEPVPEPVTAKRPELPHKEVPSAPELKPVTKTAPTPRAGAMSHAAAKIVGKLGGAMAGTLIGRPMYGWAVGGELAPELLNRIMAARSAKITAAPITVAEMTALDPVEKAGIQNGITRRLIENVEKGEPLPPLKKFENVLTREQMQQVMQAAMKNKAKAKPTGNPTATPSATPSATPAGGGGHAGNVAMSAEELSRPG